MTDPRVVTFGRTRIEFLRDLLDKHADDQIHGFCLRCVHPPRFFPCEIRERVVDELVRLGQIPGSERSATLRGK